MHLNYGNSNIAGKAIHCRRVLHPGILRPLTVPTLLFFLTVAANVGFTASAAAQTPQEDIRFARELRAHFMPDLAGEFLEHPSNPLTGAWRAAVVIERSRAKREYALKAGNSRAAMLIDSARRNLHTALQDADAKVWVEPFVRFELARLASAEGHILLERLPRNGSDARRQPSWKQVRREIARRRPELLQECPKPNGSGDAVQLAVNEGDFAGLLSLERGRNALDVALVNRNAEQAAERGLAIRLAIAQLDALSRKESANPLTWEALAWLYLCHLDNDDAKASKKALAHLTVTKNKAAESGKRLVKALRLLWLIRENDSRAQATIHQECEDWLRQYPEAYDSEEGWKLRSFLAQSLFVQATAGATKAPVSAKQREALEHALRYCADVDLPGRDDSGMARRWVLQIAKLANPDLATRAPEKVTVPAEAWLRAQLVFGAMQSGLAELQPDARRARWVEMRSVLTKVLALPDLPRFPREKVECKQLLAHCLYMSGELALAADEGEALARKYPHAVAAAQAGNLALQALASLMSQQAGLQATEKAATLRRRFSSLADFLVQTWAHHPQVDTTRHLYSLLLAREKRFAEALDQIDALSPAYAELSRALYQGASLALEARKAMAPTAQEAAAYRDRAIRLLERIPQPNSASDAKALQSIFAGKRQLAELYLQGKQWSDLDRVVNETASGFQSLPENASGQFRSPLLALQLFAKSIAADRDCQTGRFHEGRLALAPALAIVKDPANAAILEELKQHEPVVLTRFLDLSIRTAVLDQELELAKEQLELLTKLFPDNPLDILGATMQTLGDQIGLA